MKNKHYAPPSLHNNNNKDMANGLDLNNYTYKDLKCPISGYTLLDPVIAEDGITYEREEIVNWFNNHITSPVTKQIIGKTLKENKLMKIIIDDYLQKKPAEKYWQYKGMLSFSNIFDKGRYSDLLKINNFTSGQLYKMLTLEYNVTLEEYIYHMLLTFKEGIIFKDGWIENYKKILRYDNVFECIINNNIDIKIEAPQCFRGNFSNLVLIHGSEEQIMKYLKANKGRKTFTNYFNSYANVEHSNDWRVENGYISNIDLCIKRNNLNFIKYLVTELNYSLKEVELDKIIPYLIKNNNMELNVYLCDTLPLFFNINIIKEFYIKFTIAAVRNKQLGLINFLLEKTYGIPRAKY